MVALVRIGESSHVHGESDFGLAGRVWMVWIGRIEHGRIGRGTIDLCLPILPPPLLHWCFPIVYS